MDEIEESFQRAGREMTMFRTLRTLVFESRGNFPISCYTCLCLPVKVHEKIVKFQVKCWTNTHSSLGVEGREREGGRKKGEERTELELAIRKHCWKARWCVCIFSFRQQLLHACCSLVESEESSCSS